MIAVGPDARRFVNESNPYHDICIAMFENRHPKDERFYFICDHEFLKKRVWFNFFRGRGPSSYERAGYIQVADTLAALAAKIGLDPKALEQTVQEHNEHARTGVDPYFQRGESAFNRTLGEPSVGKINPNLGPIRIGPFVALRIVPATLGTATGLATDTHCGCSTSGAS